MDRAFSAYSHLRREMVENLSFEDFLKDENRRINENWDILNLPKASGLFYGQVKAYMDHFSNVKVCLIDDFKNNPLQTIREIFGFLEVDDSFSPDVNIIHNKSPLDKESFFVKVARSENIIKTTLHRWIKRYLTGGNLIAAQKRWQNIVSEQMNPQTRKELHCFFLEDIEKLENLIQRDLGAWKLH